MGVPPAPREVTPMPDTSRPEPPSPADPNYGRRVPDRVAGSVQRLVGDRDDADVRPD